MIVLNAAKYGEGLTLERLARLYDSVFRPDDLIISFPDEVWITQWQQDNILSSLLGAWSRWRGIPLVVKGATINTKKES